MKNIFKKELARVFSDKKMIFSLFVLPAVLMFGIYGLMGMLMDNMVSDIEEHVGSVYVQNAPEGFEELAAQSGYDKLANVTYLEADASAEKIAELKDGILNGGVDLLVTFDAQFMEKAAAYQNAGDPIPSVTMAYNSSLNYSNAARSTFNGMMLGALETGLLQSRFGNLDLLTVFNTETEVIVNEDKANGEFLAMMLPYLIVMLLFAGSMGLVVDAIAGEKERGTMANMLLSPIKRSSIVFGKLFGLSVLSVMSSLVYAVSMILAMPMMMDGMGEMGGAVSFSPLQIVELLGIIVSLVLFNVSALCLISVFAKNAKEANAYVMPLYMAVIVLGMLTMFNTGGAAPATTSYAIPIYGSSLAIQALVNNELTLVQFGLSAGVNVVLMLVIVFAISKVFNNEKVMLNA
ncbi:MAG: ABC transporter permease [Lachnospiraceae bacterium]|nr:ABC transporter permease [Lachnospiraceae bacterium]